MYGAMFSFLVILLAANSDVMGRETPITLATYNLWNVMFNWDVRKFRIAQMIKEANPDIIGFQEVRAHKRRPGNQVLELQQLLPQYPWHAFEAAHEVSFPKEIYVEGYELEGVGLLSKFHIFKHAVQNLTYHTGPDTNHRVALHADIEVNNLRVHVTVLHLSYYRQQQCANAAEILEYLHEKQSSKEVVIIGDFNAYTDFEWPVEIFLADSRTNRCNQYLKPRVKRQHIFSDSWKTVHPDEPGLTFSNMPVPGLESRPDRILVSEKLYLTAGYLLGTGQIYKERYSVHVTWNRLSSVISTGYTASGGQTGRSCWHDCGPHASCRCGVCVGGGDENFCILPDCTECNSRMFHYFLLCLFVFILLLAQLIYAFLKFLHTMNSRGRSEVTRFFGINCCLLDTRLYMSVTPPSRKNRCHRMWPLLRLPPVLLIVLSILLCSLCIEVMGYIFHGAIEDVNSIIPEEMFPSDHQMLIITVTARQ